MIERSLIFDNYILLERVSRRALRHASDDHDAHEECVFHFLNLKTKERSPLSETGLREILQDFEIHVHSLDTKGGLARLFYDVHVGGPHPPHIVGAPVSIESLHFLMDALYSGAVVDNSDTLIVNILRRE